MESKSFFEHVDPVPKGDASEEEQADGNSYVGGQPEWVMAPNHVIGIGGGKI